MTDQWLSYSDGGVWVGLVGRDVSLKDGEVCKSFINKDFREMARSSSVRSSGVIAWELFANDDSS